MKQFMPVIAVFVFLSLGAVFFITKNNSSSSEEASIARAQTAQLRAEISSVVLTLGEPSAPATVIEYMDYKCPVCSTFHHTTALDINEQYIDPKKAKYEIRITPIIGPDSANAGRGAYCANDQGLFSQYHESVMNYMWDTYYSKNDLSKENVNILTTTKLSEITSSTGLDQEVFKSCVNSNKFNRNLDNNLLLATDDNIKGTPGFKIGTQSFVGIQPFNVYKTLLDIELRG